MIGRDMELHLGFLLLSAPSPLITLLTRFGSIPSIQSRTLSHVPSITRLFSAYVTVHEGTPPKTILTRSPTRRARS